MANPIDIYGYIMIHYIVSHTYNEHYHVLMHTYMIYIAKKRFIFSWGINKQLKKGGATQHTHTHIYIYVYICTVYIYIYMIIYVYNII